MTFSPVKSIRALWAVAPPHVASQVEMAHHEAVRDALTFLEDHALYTVRASGRRRIRSSLRCRG
ncbi:relaxase domain-containing protein [Calidifontibacter indicus]|uniref:relaxase domain-containing protein n=1 Tax=Calidifontibacter indicus TaxID=419650 RepID=UPI003D720C53